MTKLVRLVMLVVASLPVVAHAQCPTDTVKTAVKAFVQDPNKGAAQFLYQYYNLLGSKANAERDTVNSSLVDAFGISSITPTGTNAQGFPYWSRATVQSHVDGSCIRTALRDLFTGSDYGLTGAQRLFLIWNFDPAVLTYGSNFSDTDGRSTVVGWDMDSTRSASANEWNLYTFGTVECTDIVAYTQAGDGYLSHYDLAAPVSSTDTPAGPVSSPQMAGLRTFLQGHPGATVVVMGVYALQVADYIQASTYFGSYKPATLLYMVKPAFRSEAWSVRVSRGPGGSPTISYNNQALGQEYIPSIQTPGPLALGLSNEIFPGTDADYSPANLTAVARSAPPINGPAWTDTFSQSVTINQSGASLTYQYPGSTYYGMFTSPTQVVMFQPAAESLTGTLSNSDESGTTIKWSNGVVFKRPPVIDGKWISAYEGAPVTITQSPCTIIAPAATYPCSFHVDSQTHVWTLYAWAGVTGKLNAASNVISWSSGYVYTRENPNTLPR